MIIAETLSVRDARVRLPSILERFRAGDHVPVALGAHGRAEAVLISADLFAELTAAIPADSRVAAPVDPLVAAAAALRVEPRTRRWAHLSLCILDAVYSIGQRYEHVVEICNRYSDLAGLRDRYLIVGESSKVTGEQDLCSFRDWAVQRGADRLAEEDLQCRNRTHRNRLAPYKSIAVIAYADVLCRHGITSLRDAANLLTDGDRLASVEADLRRVPGNGLNDIRLDYFWMLVGDDQRIKPDTMVRRWVGDALSLPSLPTAADARAHVVATAHKIGCTPWELDHAIWLHQRRIPRPAGRGKWKRTDLSGNA